MYLIFGKGKVGKALASLCDYHHISYEIKDDNDNEIDFSNYEAIIPSPGVPSSHTIYQMGKVISELDFAFQFLPKDFQIVAITGTDGKSTTAWVMYNILDKYGFDKSKIYLSGNFDVPFSQTVKNICENNEKEGIIVVEISSFMAYFIGKSKLSSFSPNYTIFTNLKTDHLDWHRDLQEYYDAKMNLVEFTKNRTIMNKKLLDFVENQKISSRNYENIRYFADNSEVLDFSDGENIFIGNQEILTLCETHFSGFHNALNILSVLMVCDEMKCDMEKVVKITKTITGLPHRLENLGKYGKVQVIEDSKSTSAQSLEAALGAFGKEKNILLIAGGWDKGDTFSHLENIFGKRVKALICIGKTKKYFSDIAKNIQIPFLETDNLEEGVSWLYEKANENDILLLSPGCSSFGLFKDYLDRATQFREALKKIPL